MRLAGVLTVAPRLLQNSRFFLINYSTKLCTVFFRLRSNEYNTVVVVVVVAEVAPAVSTSGQHQRVPGRSSSRRHHLGTCHILGLSK